MPAKLLYRDVKGREGSVDLANDPVYVGRANECAIRTDDAMVSRRHSVVRLDDGRYIVEDLQSANGTEVNTVKVQRQVLNHNDTVRCGSLWLRFVISDGGGVPPLAAAPGAGGAAGGAGAAGGVERAARRDHRRRLGPARAPPRRGRGPPRAARRAPGRARQGDRRE